MSAETEWPEGVTARYLTVGGATVDLTDRTNNSSAHCTAAGCNWGKGMSWSHQTTRDCAQEHAETCRAMPKPDGAR